MSLAKFSVCYFVPDLSDPAVHRRANMFEIGGVSDLRVVGFQRAALTSLFIEKANVTSLGSTRDAKLVSRAASILLASFSVFKWGKKLTGVTSVVARNLEMLLLASIAKRLFARKARLVYEVLDVHRLMVGSRLPSRALRILEAFLLRSVDLLIVSSPAFLSEYFEPYQRAFPETLLIENKVVTTDDRPAVFPDRGRPWKIGWFGMLRCQKSLRILAKLANDADGQIEVVLRGRVAESAFDDFATDLDSSRFLTFGGAYSPQDLKKIYGKVDFAWAIDYFEEGQNSSWLLPNRLYECQYFGAVPIALAQVETGRWLERHASGLVIKDPVQDLPRLLSEMDTPTYARLAQRSGDLESNNLAVTKSECEHVVDKICSGNEVT